MHKKLSVCKNGQEYVYGKRDYFAVVIAFRYLLQDKEFLEFKQELSTLLKKADEQNAKLSVTDLLEMMGMPANWSKITTYKKV